jgi:hypothetical protein
MLHICKLSNKFDLNQAIRVSHTYVFVQSSESDWQEPAYYEILSIFHKIQIRNLL